MLRGRGRSKHCAVDGCAAGRGQQRTTRGFEIVINGGRAPTGRDALAWALEGEKRGAGELVVNSIDADGTRRLRH